MKNGVAINSESAIRMLDEIKSSFNVMSRKISAQQHGGAFGEKRPPRNLPC
jgi:hypothetical protein